MIKCLFEWYRTVNATPQDDVIKKRSDAVNDLVQMIIAPPQEKAPNKVNHQRLPIQLAAAVGGGLEKWGDDSATVAILVDAIRAYQPAFPADLQENALELRVMAGVVLGEYMNRSLATQEKLDLRATAVASGIVSALSVRLPVPERFLNQMLQELDKFARELLSNVADSKRKRTPNLTAPLASLTPAADVPSFWKALGPLLQTAIGRLEEQVASDHEEIDILWWFLAGHSERLNMHMRDVAATDAAIVAGVELADRVIVPSTLSSQHLLRRIVDTHDASNIISIRDLMVQLSVEARSVMQLSANNKEEDIVASYPELFPLATACREKQVNLESWPGEKGSAARWKGDEARPLALWSIQAFNEGVAQRLIRTAIA
jgi:hypothetical protein